jgi:hypothetical protein
MPPAERRRRQLLDMTVDQRVNCRGGGMPQIPRLTQAPGDLVRLDAIAWRLTTVCRSFARTRRGILWNCATERTAECLECRSRAASTASSQLNWEIVGTSS